ncbi:MAG: phosphoribosyltransferase [Elusimicrobia bacterium]|nr:MAG: phosphoribosyltransferase [Elusimicrobiota bacterium]KAF0157363.1 MAG: phosphoribosyltransferase [Elusimicrobiota bacterium]
MLTKHIWGLLLNALLPRTCAHCAEDLPAGTEQPLCGACLTSLERPAGPLCPVCGLPGADGPCPACREAPRPFDLARSAFLFTPPLRSLTHAFKYSGRTSLARPLALLMAAELPRCPELGTFDAVVPVPLHPSRERRRGYNQAALLARELAGLSGSSFEPGAVRRVRETRPQVDLRRRERLENVRGAFEAGPGAKGRRFLVVDDVATTLATAGDAARALKEAGAAGAAVFTLAREA